jgi:hypothetical protein
MGSVASNIDDDMDIGENYVTEEQDEGGCDEDGVDSLRIAVSNYSDIRLAEKFLQDQKVNFVIKPGTHDEIRRM